MARPDMPDCPIVYASEGFLDLTGYPRYDLGIKPSVLPSICATDIACAVSHRDSFIIMVRYVKQSSEQCASLRHWMLVLSIASSNSQDVGRLMVLYRHCYAQGVAVCTSSKEFLWIATS